MAFWSNSYLEGRGGGKNRGAFVLRVGYEKSEEIEAKKEQLKTFNPQVGLKDH